MPYFLEGALITKDAQKMYERSTKKIEQLGLPAKGHSGSMDLNMYGLMFSALSFLLELKLKERCLLGLKRPSNAVYCPDKQKWV